MSGGLPFSILIASRNEGDLLRSTVADVLWRSREDAIEVIVVDDASTDGSTDFLKEQAYEGKPIALVRNDTRRGLIESRAIAADQARGRSLVFLDAHCALSPGWLAGLEAGLERIHRKGIVSPAIHPLRREGWTIERHASLVVGCTIANPFLDFVWEEPRLIDDEPCTAVIGGMAWMVCRDWYTHLGGLDRGMVSWGGENLDLALRTWVAGGRCVVANDVLVGHLFRKSSPSPVDVSDLTFNKVRCAHTVFSKETFERMLSSLQLLDGFVEALERIHADPGPLGRLKAHLESVRERSDSWIIDRFRLPLFEPPFFHCPPRKLPEGEMHYPRPSVSLVVPARGGDGVEVAAELVEKTSYANCDVLLVSSERWGEAPSPREAQSRAEHVRLRRLAASFPLEGGKAENLAAEACGSDYLVFLPEDAEILDGHWLEKFILLAEEYPRLLMACPRTRLMTRSSGSATEELFASSWSWDSPGFSTEEKGRPRADTPYQAFSCPDTALFVHRGRFLELGGFDRTVEGPLRPIMDLAIRGWLSGYEVFCHPGITVGRFQGTAQPREARRPPFAARSLHYAQLLPALKCFSNTFRVERCLERSPLAEPLVRKHARHIDERRAECLLRAHFHDDWLFKKFGLETPP